MLNIVVELEGSNLNPVLESFGLDSHSYVIPKERSEAVIRRIFQELSREKGYKRAEMALSATRCGETRFFSIGEIYYLESFRNLIVIFGEGGSFEFYGTLCKAEQLLENLGFLRIHHSYIISLFHIRTFRYSHVIMDNGMEISIGRKYRNGFREAVSGRGILCLNAKDKGPSRQAL